MYIYIYAHVVTGSASSRIEDSCRETNATGQASRMHKEQER